LPAGIISLTIARRLGYRMLAVGVALGCWGGYAAMDVSPFAWRSGLIVVVLAGLIWLYNAVFKSTLVGPFVMGGCRFLNVLFGMSQGAVAGEPTAPWQFGGDQLLVATGIGVYITGVAWYARQEAGISRRTTLLAGLALMIAGLVCLAMFPRVAPAGMRYHVEPRLVWPAVVAMLSVVTVRRCLMGVFDPRPSRVRAAVGQCLVSLIVLDAGICLVVCHWHYAVGVLALVAPSLLLSRWISST
jgi:4-hydroxybenzoate polyprenyltransferase